MKNFLFLAVLCLLIGFCLPSCTSAKKKYDTLHQEDKQVFRTVTGGVIGALLETTTLGAVAGAFSGDIVNLFLVEEPKPLFPEEEDEARKEDIHIAQLLIQEIIITPQSVENGSTIEAHVRYLLSGPTPSGEVRVTEQVVLTNLSDKNFELTKREVYRKEGEYNFSIKFRIPDDVPEGDYVIFTTVSNGSSAGRAKSAVKVIESRQAFRKPQAFLKKKENTLKKNSHHTAKLSIQEIIITPQSVENGSTIEAHVRYLLSGPTPSGEVRVTEQVVLTNLSDKNFELTKREVYRKEGEYNFSIKFRIPDDVPEGDYVIFTTVSNGSSAGRAKSAVKVIESRQAFKK